jgi:hypothetical protein
MATTILNGGTLTLTINAIARSEQITSAVLTVEQTRNAYNLIGGTKAFKVVDNNVSLAIEAIQDWTNGTTDFMDALWLASATPDTAIPFVLTCNKQVFSGSLFPEYPAVGGAGNDALTWSVTFQCDGVPVKTAITP